jgi:hypothetical protein
MLHLFNKHMRVLQTFFSFLLFLTLVAVGGFFLSRELLMWWGVNSFKSSLYTLQREVNNSSYSAQCLQRSTISDTSQPQIQLRFTSDTEYVVEAICSQFSNDPILISKNHLPPFISKVPGTGGVLWGEYRSAVELRVFETIVEEIQKIINMNVQFLEKSRVVGVETDTVVILPSTEKDLGTGPVASCEGYGFQCCHVGTHVGVGELITGLNECSDSCYSSCSSRPLVLSFNTTPLFDPRTRQVTVSSGAAVDFSYVGDAPGATSLKAILDFGDASTPVHLEGTTGKTTHVYSCPTGSCTYAAKLSLVDNWKVDSFDSSISKIEIVVQAR